MAGEIHGTATWPGLLGGTISAIYSCSHGISPGRIQLVAQPLGVPAAYGVFTIGDGVNPPLTLPDCRLESVKVVKDASGTKYVLSIADRRWRWPSFGAALGVYNQRDKFNKINSWTAATPEALCVACLTAMGETRYSINLPRIGAGGIIGGGEPQIGGIPVAGSWPAVNWDGLPPMQALQTLVEALGCHVIYRPDTDSILIAPVGVGATLPTDIPAEYFGPALSAPARPDTLLLLGAPIRYQIRLALEAVGEEWDGSLWPIDLLSYAPIVTKTQPMKITLTFPASVSTLEFFRLRIEIPEAGNPGVIFQSTVSYSATAPTVANAVAGINAALQPAFVGTGASSAVVGNTVVITGSDPFKVDTLQPAAFLWKVTQDPTYLAASWNGIVGVPLFPPKDFGAPTGTPSAKNVNATDRLTGAQASALAQKSVFRYYRILNADPGLLLGGGTIAPLPIPLYGTITRRQQLLLEDHQVQQVTPKPLDATVKGKDGTPLVRDFYNGFSRDEPAKCYGAYASNPTGVVVGDVKKGSPNTPASQEVIVDFEIDVERQLVIFSEPVYFQLWPTGQKPAALVLQTAVQVRDAVTNQIVRYQRLYQFPGVQAGTPPAVIRRDDVQALLIQSYDSISNPIGIITNDNEVAAMADFYLLSEARKYEVTGALEARYIGIWGNILPDGAIRQVTYSIGDKARTTAGWNTEHDYYTPQYPDRRRAEYLAAVQAKPTGADGAVQAIDPTLMAQPKFQGGNQ